MGLLEFLEHIKSTSEAFFSSLPEKHYIQHITHLDTDGLSSGAIVVQLLAKKDLRFTTTVLPTLDEGKLPGVVKDSVTHYIFSDLGSGQMKILKQYLANKSVLILDHHEVDDANLPSSWLHVNPRDFDVDGSSELSASGVCYLFAKATDETFCKAGQLAMLGATGDIQDKQGFIGANATILEEALQNRVITPLKTLKYYGVATSTLSYLLEWGKDVYIPGVTGKRGASIAFLQNIGIDHEIGGKPVRLCDLSEVQFNRLVQAIITARKDEDNASDVLCKIYEVPGQPTHLHTRNLKEFSALLNACGRMGKYAVGIGTCLGDVMYRDLSGIVYKAYKEKISEAIRWYKSTQHERTDSYILINGEERISPTIIGTLASIVARQPDVNDGMYIISLARNTKEHITKLSLRVAGDQQGYDLNEFIRGVCDGMEGIQAGGHSFAAGAVLPIELEEVVISKIKSALSAPVAQVVSQSSSDEVV